MPLLTLTNAHLAYGHVPLLDGAAFPSPGQNAATAPDNHSDLFYLDEAALSVGLRTMLRIAVDYLQAPKPD